jgi:hypothetical protein
LIDIIKDFNTLCPKCVQRSAHKGRKISSSFPKRGWGRLKNFPQRERWGKKNFVIGKLAILFNIARKA